MKFANRTEILFRLALAVVPAPAAIADALLLLSFADF
jgi:hypothetical protein